MRGAKRLLRSDSGNRVDGGSSSRWALEEGCGRDGFRAVGDKPCNLLFHFTSEAPALDRVCVAIFDKTVDRIIFPIPRHRFHSFLMREI